MSMVTTPPIAMSDEEIRTYIETLLKEKGENALSQQLQQRIQRTKKIESETAATTKKAEAERKQCDSLREESGKILTKCRVLEQHCTNLSKETSDFAARKEKRDAEWAAKKASVGSNVDAEVATLNAKMDADDVIIKEKEEENAVLKSSFDSMKAEFDEAFKAYEASWKEREEKAKLTILKLQETHRTNETLKAHAMMQDKHVQRLTEAINAYSQQLEMYESRFGEVEQTSMRSDEIKELADRQQKQIQEQIDIVEASRKMDLEEKQRFDNETQKLRTKAQQLKKRLIALEKTKNAAESKCRDSQKKRKAM